MTDGPLFLATLRLADDALVLGHRLSEWCGHAPVLEEDLALANLGLDLIGQARSLYSYAGTVEGRGRDEDQLAYLRREGEYRNLLLVEQPNGDFAVTMTRQLLFSAFMHPFHVAMKASSDPTLAAIAAKAEKEMAYHVRHTGEWLIRLGDGTAESHRRAQAALDELWPYSGELFEVDEAMRAAIEAGFVPDPEAIRPRFDETIDHVLAEATLNKPKVGAFQAGGRAGRHSEHMGFLLADLQYMQRTYPNATW
ncbi:1,2-phenylacetyl-CoA epoxidase subunit PaaC [Phreatobacter stygius]|uniref:Phenylacetate-CoA oxygenase subunit PaaI n=1 Tax=Phreatobacter stygius TaxID=1940610 RepID=A0A4D7B6W9_9HYPH|nr:1,2-phenylacetyl-CoA epoxidase subunit PaaC [Phreatobacter stygius]QCI63902.1 phenylacetate-CoA oxygenase subunit PaaI [Phreatobacter stygius]